VYLPTLQKCTEGCGESGKEILHIWPKWLNLYSWIFLRKPNKNRKQNEATGSKMKQTEHLFARIGGLGYYFRIDALPVVLFQY